MPDKKTITKLMRRGETGETSIDLKMTDEEFWQFVNEHLAGKVEKRNYVKYSERFKEAQAAAGPGEELKEENFGDVNTEGFEKNGGAFAVLD